MIKPLRLYFCLAWRWKGGYKEERLKEDYEKCSEVNSLFSDAHQKLLTSLSDDLLDEENVLSAPNLLSMRSAENTVFIRHLRKPQNVQNDSVALSQLRDHFLPVRRRYVVV